MRRRRFIAASLGLVPACAHFCARAVPSTDHLAIGHALFDALVHEAVTLPPLERIVFVNTQVNRRVDFIDDALMGDNDVWLTPFETLTRAQGDCEDIAIAKFFVLLASGFDVANVRLLYARYRDVSVPGLATPHVVALARQPFDDPLVLDNLNVMLLPVSQRPDLEAVFSFDHRQVWEGVHGPVLGAAADRLPPWRRLLQRMAGQHDEPIVSFPGRPH